MSAIVIAGAGPAGSCAALAALGEGAAVRLFEKSSFPRHKVCGEFLSPEIEPELTALGVWDEFRRAGPSLLRSVRLRFGHHEKQWRFATPGFGLSRHRLDSLLLGRALGAGAELNQETLHDEATIVAHGRRSSAPKGRRLFGFKAHFTGPADDAVELFFGPGSYAGVSAVENGATNVCGLAPESALAEHGFDIDRLIRSWAPLARRIEPLSRSMDWLVTGPLLFSRNFGEDQYRAGDALGFVDPFTGSGILSAVVTGRLAGAAAARGVPAREYLRQCGDVLRVQYWVSSLARFALWSGLAEDLARWLPGSVLFGLTRPKIRNR
jgi:flavin-dependent dehydrogenase